MAEITDAAPRPTGCCAVAARPLLDVGEASLRWETFGPAFTGIDGILRVHVHEASAVPAVAGAAAGTAHVTIVVALTVTDGRFLLDTRPYVTNPRTAEGWHAVSGAADDAQAGYAFEWAGPLRDDRPTSVPELRFRLRPAAAVQMSQVGPKRFSVTVTSASAGRATVHGAVES